MAESSSLDFSLEYTGSGSGVEPGMVGESRTATTGQSRTTEESSYASNDTSDPPKRKARPLAITHEEEEACEPMTNMASLEEMLEDDNLSLALLGKRAKEEDLLAERPGTLSPRRSRTEIPPLETMRIVFPTRIPQTQSNAVGRSSVVKCFRSPHTIRF